MKRLSFTLLWLFFLVLLGGCQDAPTQFALIGDSPYVQENLPKYERMIERINKTQDIDWVVHLGDMKSGIANCRDEDLQGLYELNQRFIVPFVLTPGDNDWFDCQREIAGAWDRLDRLDKLRQIFYTENPALPLDTQAGEWSFW